MKVHLQYFARYREALGSAAETLEVETACATIEQLRGQLIGRGGAWQVLAEKSVMCARNQELVPLQTPLAEGDEIAFFPPVTGG